MKKGFLFYSFYNSLVQQFRNRFQKKGQKQSRNQKCDSFGIGIVTALMNSCIPHSGRSCSRIWPQPNLWLGRIESGRMAAPILTTALLSLCRPPLAAELDSSPLLKQI